jgi:hypothetical protein
MNGSCMLRKFDSFFNDSAGATLRLVLDQNNMDFGWYFGMKVRAVSEVYVVL